MAALTVSDFDYGSERLVVRLETDGPVDLEDLARSFAALEHIYERQQQEEGILAPATPARLFVSKIEAGSILIELAPLLILLNEPLQFMAATNTIKKFTENVIVYLKKFVGEGGEEVAKVNVDNETVRDLQIFIKPLTGRKAAELGITHARYEKRDGAKEVIVYYRMQAPEINIANSNLINAVVTEERLAIASNRHEVLNEVLMRLYQATVVEGKERGRTGDRAIIAAVTGKDLPLYFPKQSNDFKRIITESTDNPFAKGYIVDVDVEFEGEMPRMYRLLHVHKVVDLE
jgi:hypothetical protein